MISMKIFKDHPSMQLYVVFHLIILTAFIAMFGIPILISVGITLFITWRLLTKYYSQQNIQAFYGNVVDIETKEQKERFEEKGLTSEDMHYFKEIMDEANQQIYSIKSQIVGINELESTLNRNDTLEIIEELYGDIVNEPNRLHDVNKFLYVHLPTLDGLVTQYVRIYNHRKISEQGKKTLNETIKTIKEVGQLIDEDYLKFRDIDVQSLNHNIEMTKKRLKIEQRRNEPVDELLNKTMNRKGM